MKRCVLYFCTVLRVCGLPVRFVSGNSSRVCASTTTAAGEREALQQANAQTQCTSSTCNAVKCLLNEVCRRTTERQQQTTYSDSEQSSSSGCS